MQTHSPEVASPRHAGAPATVSDLAACRVMLRHCSKSFHAASLLLPPLVRDRAVALYAFCRIADDMVDQGEGSPEIVAELGERVTLICAGTPLDHPVDRALAAVVAETGLPQALLDAMIEGFAWDAEGRTYQDISALQDYAARVAGCVGVMMTALMGRRHPDVLARAADLGVAMQLTNIARDVGEDARNGRLYLPLDWLAEEGIDARAFLEKPTFKPGLARVVSRLLDEADGLYRRAEAGIAGLPPDCRAAIRAASLIYSEIGRVVRGHGCDSVNQRAVTSTARKLALLASAFRPGRAEPWASAAPALPANLFLVRATQGPDSFAPPSTVRLWTFPEAFNIAARARAALAIVERLEHAERRGLQPSLD